MIPFGETGKIAFTPKKDGTLALFVSAGGSAYELKQTNTALGVFAGRGVGTIGGPWKFYFRVPKDCGGFTFVGRGAGPRQCVWTPLTRPASRSPRRRARRRTIGP